MLVHHCYATQRTTNKFGRHSFCKVDSNSTRRWKVSCLIKSTMAHFMKCLRGNRRNIDYQPEVHVIDLCPDVRFPSTRGQQDITPLYVYRPKTLYCYPDFYLIYFTVRSESYWLGASNVSFVRVNPLKRNFGVGFDHLRCRWSSLDIFLYSI